MANHATPIPEVGQAVRVRNRLATVRAVEPYDSRSPQGRLHIVDLEYLDDFRYPESEQLLWEVETTAEPLGKTTLPAVDANRPDSPKALQAFVNAHRWTRLNRLRETEGIEDEPLLGVWNSAIQVHPYQLEPVIRALSMPRVSLLLADGVGLGKTIQSGLVLEELLLRRRIRRILVICPAMLQRQWRYELRRKFNLDFEVIDSDSTFQLRRRMGIDTNPWKAFPRIIASMDYLRMPDVLQQFLQASGAGPDTESNGRTLAHAPWDLLIVDECHHFAPQSGRRASQRTRMLREIRFLFEHRVFASATPHNGKTVCFTGLLELLDPIRFQMAMEMDQKDKTNLAEVRTYLDLLPSTVSFGLARHQGNWWNQPWTVLLKYVLSRFVVQQHESMSYERTASGDRCLLQVDGQRVISDSRYEKIGLGNPRLGSAVQVLTDIALLQSDENDVSHVTEEGLTLLKSELEREGEG